MVPDDIAYAEVFEILGYMSRKDIMKIPIEVVQYIKDNMNTTYKTKIDPNNIFDTNNVSKKAREILAYIDLKYLASDESKKVKLKNYTENEYKHQEYLKEKYNQEHLLKKEDVLKEDLNQEIEDNMQIVEIKELKWYQKLLEKIIQFFK